MGMYSNYDVQYDGTPSETIDSIMSDPSVVAEDYTDIKEYGLNILTTMTINYNLIHEHIAFAELKHITESGTPMVYTEGVFSSIFNAIKRFLQKIWERIKGLFKRFMMIINSYSKTDKEFANKYRKEIFAYHDLSDFTFKGYKWTIEDGKIKDAIEKCSTPDFDIVKETKQANRVGITHVEIKDYKDELEKYSDHEEAFRGECLDKLGGKKGKYTADEFRKELRACFRNGEDSKEELDDKDIDVHDMFAWLVGSKNAKKTIDTMFKDNKKAIDETLKELREIEKERVFSSQYYEPRDKVAKDSEAVKLSNYVLDLTYDMRVAIVSANDVKGAITNLSRVVTDPKDIDTFKLIMKRFADAQVTGVEHTNDTHYQKAFNMIKLEIENIIDVDPTSSSYTHRLDFRNTGSDENILITGKDRQKRHALALQLAMKKTHTAKQCLIEIDTAALDAIKERSRQYKACLIKIVHHKGKSEAAYTESTAENDYFFKSNPVDTYLGSITFK